MPKQQQQHKKSHKKEKIVVVQKKKAAPKRSAAMRPTFVPAAFGAPPFKAGITGMDSMKVTVAQWLAPVAVSSTYTTSAILDSYFINPQTLGTEGRLGRMSRLFEKYRFESLEVSYVPQSSTSSAGSIFICLDNDPTDSLTNLGGQALMNAVMSMGNRAVMTPIWQPVTVRASGSQFFSQDLYVDSAAASGGDRFSQAGRIVIGQVGTFAANATVGWLTIKARLRLLVPSLEDAGSGGGYSAFKLITSPSSSAPWGTNLDFAPVSTNLDLKYAIQTPTGASASCVTFANPGVYLLTWYQTGTTLSAGTMQCFAGAAFSSSNLATTSGFTTNPKIFHPSGEALGWALITVSNSGGYVTYTSSGTHTANANNFLSIVLTSAIVPPQPTVNVGDIEDIHLQLKELLELKRQFSSMGCAGKPAPALPTFSGTTTSSFEGTITPYGGQPEDISLTSTSSSEVSQDLPVDVVVPGADTLLLKELERHLPPEKYASLSRFLA